MEIKSFTLPYCVKKKKTKDCFSNVAGARIDYIKEMLDSNVIWQNQEYFEANKAN